MLKGVPPNFRQAGACVLNEGMEQRRMVRELGGLLLFASFLAISELEAARRFGNTLGDEVVHVVVAG